MNPMNVIGLILITVWLVTNSISLGLLSASVKELFESMKLAKKLLADMPEDLQKAALKAIAEDRARFALGEFTEAEKANIAFARKGGAAAGARVGALIAKAITNEKEKGQ